MTRATVPSGTIIEESVDVPFADRGAPHTAVLDKPQRKGYRLRLRFRGGAVDDCL